MDLKKRFGKLVAANRRHAGLTQHQLAAATGLSNEMIARIETGTTGARFGSIEKIAAALEVDPAELFTADLPKSSLRRKALTDVTAKLAGLSDDDLAWVGGVLDAALKRRR